MKYVFKYRKRLNCSRVVVCANFKNYNYLKVVFGFIRCLNSALPINFCIFVFVSKVPYNEDLKFEF
jgi:hypothetical protein